MKRRLITALTASLIIAFSALDIVALSAQYPLEITANAKSDVAEIRISGVIHQWQNSASEFKRKIDDMVAKGIKDVNLYINTPGGNVFEANEIANEIKKFTGKISGFGGALVASAGSYLALICDTFEMADNGQYMYHKPSGLLQGNEDKIASDLKLLQNLTKQYRTAYSEKTGLSEDTIEANWVKGDVWLSAKEALEQKFITGISKTKAVITQEQKALFTACGAPKSPRITPNSNTEHTMNIKILAQNLGLPEDASEEQINAQILKNKQDAATANQLKASADAKEKVEKEKNITEMFNGAIASKKMNTKQAEELRAWADSDFEACKKYVDSLQGLGAVSKDIRGGSADTAVKDFEAMTEEEQKELSENDPEAFQKSYEAYLKK